MDPEKQTENETANAIRQLSELEGYVNAEVAQLQAEVDSLTVGFNIMCVCIIALTSLLYLIDKDSK